MSLYTILYEASRLSETGGLLCIARHQPYRGRVDAPHRGVVWAPYRGVVWAPQYGVVGIPHCGVGTCEERYPLPPVSFYGGQTGGRTGLLHLSERFIVLFTWLFGTKSLPLSVN